LLVATWALSKVLKGFLYFDWLDTVGINNLQLARLFAKLPWPGDSEVTFSIFESSCNLLLPI